MKLIEEIIDLLSSGEFNLKIALLKTKVLLHKLGEKELLDWVNCELKGYSGNESVPDYRILHVTIMGNVSNMAYRYSNQTLPVMHLDEVIRERLVTKYLMDGIAVIEQYSKQENLNISVAPEFYPYLSEGYDSSYQVENAWAVHSAGAMTQILTEVNSRLLDFVLALSEKFPSEMDSDEMKTRSKEVGVSDLFNNAVFGDNATIVVGDSNTQTIKNSVIKNDLPSLIEVLKQHKVSDEDIAELETSIENDNSSDEIKEGKYGTEVSNWMGKMIGKAASTAWDVKVGAAGSLLATAISKFYGF
ncbi:hypothetical protein I6F40_00635 [Pseudoalteromonas sp. SWXJ133]|uniref:AbiTii domain-containing protein n=1 Tax=Pseudoalteromonas sp. SWXJ133 TaxID=2792069 RepID=UPI0018CFAE23|nr:hypothetical protein [Pseudoalteromonas sp. SWXJ133]MBH0018881.1 hypothetical protein [Pseudoalteromonas sp. SWXJ133]